MLGRAGAAAGWLLAAAPALVSGGEAYLATTHPGPFALLVHWGAASNGTATLSAGSWTQQVATAPGWTSLPLPAAFTPLEVPLRWTTPGGAPPRLVLYGTGEPVRLATTTRGLEPEYAALGRPSAPAPGRLACVLPVRSAARLRVTVSPTLPPAADLVLPVAVGQAATQVWVRAGSTEGFCVLEAPVDSGAPAAEDFVLTVPRDPPVPALTLIIEPLAERLAFRPCQGGAYYFRTYDAAGRAPAVLAGHWPAGPTAEVGRPDRWLGGCLHFIPAGEPQASDLESDAVVVLEGFHSREPARDRIPPYQRWTSRSNAVLRVTCPPACDVELRLRVESYAPENLAGPTPALAAAGWEMPLTFTQHVWQGVVKVPPGSVRDGVLELNMRSALWSPAETVGSDDRRALGLLLAGLEVGFRPAAGAPR